MKTLSEKKDIFRSYIKQNYRDYQVNSFKKTFDNNIGQFSLPTGTGKTHIQKYIHAREALLKENLNQFATCVIVAHRLLLCRQLLEKLCNFFKLIGLEYDVIFVGSAGQNDIMGLMDKDKIKEKHNKIKKNKKHVIIASTYHSLNKLSSLDEIDVCTFDEAHNIVLDDPKETGQFKINIEKIKPIIKKEYYFTATPKSFIDSSGKIDETFFGKMLNWMSPREAIDKKYIVEPALLIGETFREKGEDIDPNNNNVIVQSIIENFEYQEIHSNLAPKVLISFKSIQKDLVPIYEDKRLVEWCNNNNITRLMFSSTKTGNRINNKTYKHISNEMLSELDKIKKDPTAKCLFMHYDVLSEGIDIPNMTGILLFRDLEKHELKFIQNVGRCCRPQPGKEYAYVSIPDYLLEEEKYKEIILQLYTSYDFKDFSDIKVFVGTKKGNGGERDVKQYRSGDISDLEINHKLITFDFDIAKKSLDSAFIDSKNKEQFLLDLINQIYPEEEIIELTDEVQPNIPPVPLVSDSPEVPLNALVPDEPEETEQETLSEGEEDILKERLYFKRNPKLRKSCLKKYGYDCCVCKNNSEIIHSIIEVHHEKEFSRFEKEHTVPIEDLKPVCPNCHEIIHKRRPCRTIEEAQRIINKRTAS